MQGVQPLVAIVEDDTDFRVALARLLDSSGFAVEAFASGEEFLHFVEHQRPDCVVLDLNMAGLSGLEVQSHLVASKINIPVVILTGNDTPKSLAQATSGGAKAYLRKPVDEEELLQAISTAPIR